MDLRSDMKINPLPPHKKIEFWTFLECRLSSDLALTPDLFPDGWILWWECGAIEPEHPLVDGK